MGEVTDAELHDEYQIGKLVFAACCGKDTAVEKYLNKGINIDSADYDGRTSLHVACAAGKLGTVKLLLKRGANVNVKDRRGGTPLDDAYQSQHLDIAKVVEEHGGRRGRRKNSRAIGDRTSTASVSPVAVFLFACAKNDLSRVKKLCTGAPNSPIEASVADYDKRTGLHLAACEGHMEIIKYLVENGADVNAVDRWNHTPLYDAERCGQPDIAKYLSEQGGTISAYPQVSAISTTKDILHALQKRGEVERWAVNVDEVKMDDRPFAKGAAGEIFRAKWRGLECVAKTWLAATPQMMIDLGNEISLLSTFRHPHLIMFLGACFLRQPPLLLMEYCGGGTLEQRLIDAAHKQKLSKLEKIRYTYELALGMNFLHSCSTPVVHRDLKPSNILLTVDGRVKITDFGLSKYIPSKNKHMNDTFAMTGETGSYRFMAPEVFRHEAYSLKVDVYSFAFIVFWIFSGVRPLVHFPNPVDAVRAAALKGVRPPLEIVTDEPIKALLTHAWSANPVERPRFEEILDYLEQHGYVPDEAASLKKQRPKCAVQ